MRQLYIHLSPLTPTAQEAEVYNPGLHLICNELRILVVNIKTMSVSTFYSKCKYTQITQSLQYALTQRKKQEINLPKAG